MGNFLFFLSSYHMQIIASSRKFTGNWHQRNEIELTPPRNWNFRTRLLKGTHRLTPAHRPPRVRIYLEGTVKAQSDKTILCGLMGKSFNLSESQIPRLLNGHSHTSQGCCEGKWDNGCESTCKPYGSIIYGLLLLLICQPTQLRSHSDTLTHTHLNNVDWKPHHCLCSLLPHTHQSSPLCLHFHNQKTLLCGLSASNLGLLDSCSLLKK